MTYTYSWLRIERSIEVLLSELFCLVVAGVGRDSLADPITISERCKSGSALSLRQDSLLKARLALAEAAMSCLATQRVWSFSPSLTLARNVGARTPFII